MTHPLHLPPLLMAPSPSVFPPPPPPESFIFTDIMQEEHPYKMLEYLLFLYLFINPYIKVTQMAVKSPKEMYKVGRGREKDGGVSPLSILPNPLFQFLLHKITGM